MKKNFKFLIKDLNTSVELFLVFKCDPVFQFHGAVTFLPFITRINKTCCKYNQLFRQLLMRESRLIRRDKLYKTAKVSNKQSETSASFNHFLIIINHFSIFS